MAIIGRSNTLFCQNVPAVRLEGDQSYVYDNSNQCFVQADECGCSTTTDGAEITETINCYHATGDGSTSGYILPWVAPNEQSLIITLDGVKQYDLAYTISINETAGTTLVTFSQNIPNAVEIDIIGFVVANASNIKRYELTASGAVSSITVPWIANSEESMIVTIDGVKQTVDYFTISYTPSGSTILSLDTPVPDGSTIEVIGIQGLAANSFRRFTDTGDGGTTDYVIPWYAISCGSLLVSLDGAIQGDDAYTITPIDNSTTTVSFDAIVPNGVVIDIIGFTGLGDLCEACAVVGNNLGLGSQVYNSAGTSGGTTTLNFRTLVGGAGITLSSDANTITIESDSVNSLQNVGGGSEILVEPIGATVDFRTLVAGTGVTLTQSGTEITIDTDGDASSLGGFDATDYVRTASSVGTGVSLISKATGDPDSNLEFYSLKGGSGIVVARVGDEIFIADANGGNYVDVVDDYVMERDDRVIGVTDTSAPRTITLINTATVGPGKFITVGDESGNASVNNITVDGFGAQLVGGSGSTVIDSDYGTLTFYTDGTEWYLVSSAVGGNAITIDRVIGKQTIWIPAGAMRPTVTDGAPSVTDIELNPVRPNMQVIEFDQTANEYVQFQIAMPKQWDKGTITYQAFWTTAVTSGTVVWGMEAVAVSNEDAVASAYGTPVTISDDSTGANIMLVTDESGPLTIAGTPQDDDVIFFRFYRDAVNGSDDLSLDARLIGIKVFFTTEDVRDN